MLVHDRFFGFPRLLDIDRVEGLALAPDKASGLVLTEATEYVPSFVLQRHDTLVCTLSEVANCSPVIPTDELIRIRDEAIRRGDGLSALVGNLGGSLQSQGCVDAYAYFWSWLEGRNWCIYTKDEPIFQQIQNQGARANNLIAQAGRVFLANFQQRWIPMRNVFSELQAAASAATIDIRPTLEAYRKFWNYNFSFSLHRGLNNQLDGLLDDYARHTNASEAEFDRGNAKVQGNFDAHYQVISAVYKSLSGARSTWDNVDGRKGYDDFTRHFQDAATAYQKWGEFVVLKSPANDAKFSTSEKWATDIKSWKGAFPTLSLFSPVQGMQKGGGIPEFKFFCTSAMSILLHRLGAEYLKISQGHSGYEFRNLFVTNLSYEHGGAFPPHAEHKDGKDADIWGRWLDMTKPDYVAGKTQMIIEAALRLGAVRVIFSDQGVVNLANQTAQHSGWAGRAAHMGGHQDHIHVDVS